MDNINIQTYTQNQNIFNFIVLVLKYKEKKNNVLLGNEILITLHLHIVYQCRIDVSILV